MYATNTKLCDRCHRDYDEGREAEHVTCEFNHCRCEPLEGIGCASCRAGARAMQKPYERPRYFENTPESDEYAEVERENSLSTR